MVWRNWAGEQRCAPASFGEPSSEDELVEAVARAAAAGHEVRVAGSGHSFTDIACTDGAMLSLRRMDRILSVEDGVVEVQGGVRLRELGAALAARGLAMENLGDVDAQSLAGSLATGTHGTGARFRNLSSQVTAMRIVSADGSVVVCSDGDLLRAARIGLGALGVVSTVTLRCVPLYTLRRVDAPMPLDEALERIDELVDGREHFEFFTFPYSGVALTRTTETTGDPPAPPGPAREWVEDIVLENAVFGAFCLAGRAAPPLVPAINRLIGKLVAGGERVDHSARIYANPRLVRFTEMEYSIPRAACVEAVRRVLDLIERRRMPVGFPIEVRFGAPDDAFLSPGAGRESCYIAVHVFRRTEYESYFRGVEAIMDDYDGRPHWGKRHFQTAATLRPRYPDWDRFLEVRERLDPGRVFANDYVRRVLGA